MWRQFLFFIFYIFNICELGVYYYVGHCVWAGYYDILIDFTLPFSWNSNSIYRISNNYISFLLFILYFNRWCLSCQFRVFALNYIYYTLFVYILFAIVALEFQHLHIIFIMIYAFGYTIIHYFSLAIILAQFATGLFQHSVLVHKLVLVLVTHGNVPLRLHILEVFKYGVLSCLLLAKLKIHLFYTL